MKSFLSFAAALVLAGAVVGCGGGGPSPHKDGGMPDHPGHDMGMVTPHPDGGPLDGSVGDAGPTCDTSGPARAKGAACDCDRQCGSNGHCVDGVCCESACTGPCQTCASPDAGGTCLARTAGAPPRRASDCVKDSQQSCGLDGLCDGAGSCQYYFGNTCVGGTCNGDSVVGAYACDGTGVCRPGATQMLCLPYTCNPGTGTCYQPPCTSNDQCDSQHQCDFSTGSCGKAGNGEFCQDDSGCLSNHCADHVCCNIACQGGCVACNLPGRLGTCWPIDSGKPDPRGICRDQGSSSCGHNGTCDGVGGCANYAKDTQCLQPSCTGNRLNTAGTCDGLGTCRPPGIHDCHPFKCVDGACTNACQTVNDCDVGTACINGTCGPKPIGATCGGASECASNFCVDGVCCESACNGTCQYCALPTSPGICSLVAADNPDPRGLCQDKGAAACSTNGKCDGTGSCEKYAQGTVCANETCTSGVYTGPSTCNTTGQCVAPDARPCAPFVCNGTQCFNVCATNDQCKPPNTCNTTTNSCGLKGPGAVCGSSAECQSGLSCAQGVCCNSPCAGPCQSCALPNTPGTCTNVPANQVDPAAQCLDKGAAGCGTNGKCDGNGGCQLYLQGTTCGGSTCPAGTSTFTGTSTCDGAGKCVTPNPAPCFPFQCGTNVCKNICTSDADCASPAVCNSSGSCGLKPPGQSCATAAECASGFCSQSVCCATACTGVCQSCALTTAPGTCTNVPSGTADPQGTCHDQGNTSCGTDGFCDGNGACRLYAGGTSCAPPSCPTGATSLTSGRTCDGKGTCQPASTIGCAPYICNGSTACKSACAVDGDCQAPDICDPLTNLCGNKKRLGQACTASSDCLTADSCVDGVCCSSSSCGTCQSCNVTGSAGNCANVAANTTEPHGLCAANPPCGDTGACDGAGHCQLGGTGVSCGTASCTGATFTPVSHCNGTGACAAPTSSACPGGFVCASNGTCKTACTADADCVAPLTCQGSGATKSCALKPNGQACGAANQCISGFCTDGVCCGTGPCGTCQACNVNGLGSCAPIPAGTAAPSGQCASTGACGNTGACNGAGACALAATSVTCAPATCSGTTYTPASFCSGTGSCTPAGTSSCAPYVCGAGSCKTTCNLDTDCVPVNGNNTYCTGTGGACLQVKSNGVACFSNHECSSLNCVDGVCCGSPSCPTCQACNVSGSAGTCANVPATVAEPHGRCAVTTTCGNTGACNGAGACTQAASSVTCAGPSCTGSSFTASSFCSGGGSCSTPAPTSCAPYVCGATTCNNSCNGDGDCIPNAGKSSYCTGAGGSCLPVKANGVACLSNHECGSGACVDGVCCGSPSCPTCQACNVSGSAGACTAVPGGVAEPHGRCAVTTTCGNTGTCNGASACTQAGTSVACGTSSCSGSTLTATAFCTGAGSCGAPANSSCSPYLCGAGACNNSCNGDTDCLNVPGNDNYCTGTGGSCLPVKANGVACLSNHECGSNACVDGVCCGSPSCGTCMACNVSGSLGKCANVPSGLTDPHARCAPNLPCGNTGACDGTGVCQQQPTSVMCSGPSCTGGVATLASFCSGAGSCPAPATQACGDYVCGASSCKTSCTGDTDCIGTDFCNAGTCTAKLGAGKACAADSQCGSSLSCVDGVCCTSSSCSTCQACNVSGSVGTCSPIPNGQPAPAGQCPLGATCGNTGLCNGASACQQQASGTTCAPASCSSSPSSQFTPASTCNGAGACVPGSAVSCGTYACKASGCATACTQDSDCAGGDYCSGGSCVPQQGAGGACTGADQCAAGYSCVDGFCCGSTSCLPCWSCGVHGAEGTCTPVPAGGADPTGSCPTTNQASCGDDGLCDGSGGCQKWPATTVCASSCVALILSENLCDGAGTCNPIPALTSCPTTCAAGPPDTCN